MKIKKTDIIDGMERESSLLSVNLEDKNGVSMYDTVFIDHNELLYGAISEAVGNLTQCMQSFVAVYGEDAEGYEWSLTKGEPYGLADDVLNYIVDCAMSEWCIKVLKDGGDYAGRANAALQNVARKLYFKSCPV